MRNSSTISSFCIPEKELFYNIDYRGRQSQAKVSQSRPVVTLRWSVARSSILSKEQKICLMRSLRSFVNSQGVVTIKSGRFDDLSRNIEDCQQKLITLMLMSLKNLGQRRIG